MTSKIIFVFYFNFGHHVGFGHFMRCLTLLRFFQKTKNKCFFCDINNSFIDKEILKKYKINYISLFQLKKKYNNFKKVLIVDDYQISNKKLVFLNKIFPNVVRFDDFAQRQIKADIVINNNLGVKKRHYKNAFFHKLFIGPKYSLIRDEIKRIKHRPKKNLLLITFGMSRMNKLVLSILNVILKKFTIFEAQFKIYLFINAKKRDLAKLINNYNRLDLNIFKPSKLFYKILTQCDYMISTPSVSFAEASSRGIPSILIQTDQNQVRNFIYLKKFKILHCYNSLKTLRNIFDNSLKDYSSYYFKKKISCNVKKIFNINGDKLLGREILSYYNEKFTKNFN
jgi:spore coat polysaccharide biosynthesis predicted glycosyltransferase SpsG